MVRGEGDADRDNKSLGLLWMMGKKKRQEEIEEYKTTGIDAGDLLLSPGQQ